MKHAKRLLPAGVLLVLFGACVTAADAPPAPPAPAAAPGAASAPSLEEVMKDPNRKVGFIRKTLKLDDGTERIYQVWVPLSYTPDKKWPVILFLHGKGESGTDGEKILVQGLPKEIKKRAGKFDFIVAIPQCASGAAPREPAKEAAKDAPKGAALPFRRTGWVGPDEEFALKSLQAAMRDYACDPQRVYLTGLSMGGFGTWSLAAKYPAMFAAIAPICGGGDPASAAAIAPLPAWVWHGAADNVVPPEMSRRMVEALKAAGAKEVKYTELPGVGHNSWDAAYAGDELWSWMLSHRLRSK
ncbi:MAG: hypothetical protein FJ288_14895 [Planctomycetes bacterium]|nr:hypothetical protein [Planctomycetota bacterium]